MNTKYGKLFSAAFLAVSATVFSQEDYTQWPQQANITVNTSPSGMNVTGNVLKFPYLVRLDSTFNFTQSIGQGIDVRFSRQNGAPLKYQRERWDSAGKRAEFWVLLDTVHGNNATQSFRMHWGRAAAGDSSNGAAVFDTANGFVAVWHMNNSVTNSTVNSLTIVNAGTTDIAGLVGQGRNFSGTTQHIRVANTAVLNIPVNITLSAWFKANDWGSASTINRRIMQKGNDNQYSLQEPTGQDAFSITLFGPVGDPVQIDHPLPGVWHNVQGTYDGAHSRLYLDGILRASAPTTGDINPSVATADSLEIGRKPASASTTTSLFSGVMDEVRVQNRVRDPNWIKLEFLNQKSADVVLAAPGISYAPALVVDTIGRPAGHAVTTGAGGFVNTYSIAPALSQGLSLDTITGLISGTPTGLLASTAYTVTATGPGGTGTALINISVIAAPVGVSGSDPASGFSVRSFGRGLLFGLPASSSPVEVSITDLWGRTVWSGKSGTTELVWDGTASNGRAAGRGVYIIRMTQAESNGLVFQRTVSFTP